ncbi:MAG: DUF5041 domain-containing protein [Bacteroidaceae bacterium]|nr:DUF5041 domain-containing protein [Bacteroidaceae bacterium]MBQ9642388.1 DUF5041 domain-containing protein [Bacteroidaceae bacterium]
MNKKSIITVLLALATLTALGQEIKMNEPSISDYLPLLNAKGYMAYSFNTKKLKGTEVEPVVMEYVKGKEPKEVLGFNVVMSLDKKLIIGFRPSDNDSTANYLFHFGENRCFGGRLKLNPIFDPEKPEDKWYMYDSRPFELVPPFEKGKFIPLVLYGSYWYDPKAGGCRFCGDSTIKPDLSSDIVKYIPHYYVLGIKIK